MKGKIRLFLISNLVAAALLAGCADAPPEEVVEPGAGESTQLEGTVQVEEPVSAETTQETMGETESLAGAEATTEAAGETQDVAGVEATTEAAGETQDVAGVEATIEAAGETQDVAGAEATTEAAGETQEVAGVQATQTAGEAGSEMAAVKASILLDQAIQGPQGEELVQIEDLLIGLDSNRIKYVVVSLGDALNMENKLFFIPVYAFHFDPQANIFVLDATIEQLLNIPNFEATDWPDLTNPDWDAEFRDFWQNNPLNTEEAAQPQDQTMDQAAAGEAAVRASEVMNFNIEDAQGEQIGQVEDIVIQLDTGSVQYVVLSFNDEIDNSPDFFGLQLSRLSLSPENDAFIFDADQSLLQNAPSFTPDEWNDQFNLELGQVSQ